MTFEEVMADLKAKEAIVEEPTAAPSGQVKGVRSKVSKPYGKPVKTVKPAGAKEDKDIYSLSYREYEIVLSKHTGNWWVNSPGGTMISWAKGEQDAKRCVDLIISRGES